MKKLLSYVILICMVTSVATASYNDTSMHWAENEIDIWLKIGIIMGNENLFRPDDSITRGEMAAVLNRILKYETMSLATYNDVESDMWFYEDVSRVSTVMTGDGVNFRPYDNMTREEAVVLMCKALKIEKQQIFINYDPSKISPWARGYVSAAEGKNCMPKSFDDSEFSKNVTRAEVVYILDKLIDTTFFDDGKYSIDTNKNIVLVNDKTVISNMKIDGNLIISESIANTGITISGVDVNGKIFVCGAIKGNVKFDNVVANDIIFESELLKSDEVIVFKPGEDDKKDDTSDVVIVLPENKEEKYYNLKIDSAIDKSKVQNLNNTKNGYGPGVHTDENNRPVGAINMQNKYGSYDAYFIAEKSNNIYLTFDEGYENGYTPKILDTLKEKNCKAVFFITMEYAKKNPSLVQRMIDEGHVIGNHSVKHLSMPTLSIDECVKEIKDLHLYVRENFGYEMYLFRPPMGEFSEKALAIAKELGYKTFLWSFAYRDWETDNQPEKNAAYTKITSSAHGGAIFLLHAVSKTNAEIVGDVIDSFRNLGYTVKAFEINDR